MKLIAIVSIEPGAIPPGGEFDIRDKAEAESLIARGLAAPAQRAAKAAPAPAEATAPAGASATDQAE